MTASCMITERMMSMAQTLPKLWRPSMMRWGLGSLQRQTCLKAPLLVLEEPSDRRERRASLLLLNLAC